MHCVDFYHRFHKDYHIFVIIINMMIKFNLVCQLSLKKHSFKQLNGRVFDSLLTHVCILHDSGDLYLI